MFRDATLRFLTLCRRPWLGNVCPQRVATVLALALAASCGGNGGKAPGESQNTVPDSPPTFASEPNGNAKNEPFLGVREPGEDTAVEQQTEQVEDKTPADQSDVEAEDDSPAIDPETSPNTEADDDSPATDPEDSAVTSEPVFLRYGHVASTDGGLIFLNAQNVRDGARVEVRRPDSPDIIARLAVRSPIQSSGASQSVEVSFEGDCSLKRALVETGLRLWIVNPGGAFTQQPVFVQNTVGLHPTDPCKI